MATTKHNKTQKTYSSIFQWHSLKTRVPLFTLATFLIGIWSLAFYSSQTLQNDMEKELGEQQFSSVSIIAADVNQEFEDRIKSLEMIAAKITPAMLDNAASMQTFLESHVSFPILFNYGGIVLRRNGVAIAEVPNHGRVGIDYSDREYMIEVLKGKTTISNPVMGRTSRSPFFSMLTPIRDAKGQIIGVLAGGTDLSKPNFLNQITDSKYGKTGGYLLVSPKIRTIVYATDKKRIMEVLPAPGINALIDRFIQGYEGYGITIRPSDGVETLSSAKGIPLSGWYVVALMPTAEAFAPVHTLQQHMLLAAILLSLLAGGLTLLLLKRQLTPVFSTIKTLATMSDSDQPRQPLPITRQDEIGELIFGFNHLLEILGQREKTLQEERQRLTGIIKGTNVGTWEWNVQTGETIFNDRWAEIIGYTLDEISPVSIETWVKFAHAEDLRASNELLEKHFRGELDYYEFESRMKHKDGNWIWVLDRGKVTSWTEDGKPLMMMGTHQDITLRKQSEETLEEERRRLQQALDEVRTLRGIVPICSYCKKIRDDEGYWNQVEKYISDHTDASFSHGICPTCLEKEMRAMES